MSLKLNEELLNYNFETYRVNLKKLIRKEKEICCELFDWNLKHNVVMFTKVKAFGFHNNLILDLFNPNSVYFISIDGKIFQTDYIDDCENLTDPRIIYETNHSLPKNIEQLPSNLYFPSEDVACFSDGLGYLNVIYTFNRNVKSSGDNIIDWKLLCSTSIIDNDINTSLIECRLQYPEDIKHNASHPLLNVFLHCCLLKISTINVNITSKNVELIWIVYKYSNESRELSVVSRKIYIGDCPPELVTFSNDFQTMDIISNHNFRLLSPDISFDGLCSDNIVNVPFWCNESAQTILLEFYLNISKDLFTLNFQYPTEENMELIITINLKEKEPMELFRKTYGYLFNDNKMTWNVDNELLLITLWKLQPTEETDEIVSKKPKLTMTGTEDVDDMDDTELVISSFDAIDGTMVGDEINISKNEYLFSIRLANDQPMSACLRSNVDGILWSKLSGRENWTHCHTLNAFGYIAAAKVDRKFMCCSLPVKSKNDVMFAVISDWKRELYVLMQFRKLDCEMTVKNRTTGRIVDNVADEYVITLEKSREIMGIVATNSLIFVLYRPADVNITSIAVINCY